MARTGWLGEGKEKNKGGGGGSNLLTFDQIFGWERKEKVLKGRGQRLAFDQKQISEPCLV